MVKLEPVRTAVRSRSSSSGSDGDDARSTSSSDSCLSLVETSATSKSCSSTNGIQKRKIPSSAQTLAQGTLIRDVNNNIWMLHQCVKVSRHLDRFIYVCNQVKRPPNKSPPIEQNIVKTKISPLMYLTDKLKQSRQAVIDKARIENDKLDYVFYGAVLGDANREEELILPYPAAKQQKSMPSNKGTKMIHGIVEFLSDHEPTFESKSKINKYSIEMIFIQDNTNTIQNPSELLQQVLKKEIEQLKESRRQHPTNDGSNSSHKFIITKKSGQYEIQEARIDDEPTTTTVSPSAIDSNKYLLKLELVPSSSKHYTIDHEIAFYSRFATHEKLQTYIKRHALMYLAIPEYISHGIYKSGTLTYKFLIMEQYRENLRSLIYSYDQSLPEHNALNLFLQMLFVIQFLHEKNFVHKIIKPKYLMFANKQPYFIFLTQFRTVKNINDHTIDSNEVPNENRPISSELLLKQQNSQVKKKVKRSHRTQLAAIHNKTLSIVPSPLSVVDIPSPIIEEDNLLTNPLHYHHPYSVYSSLDMHLYAKQTYRGDLEMLGYNLIVWSGGRLPWDNNNKTKLQRETIPNEKKLAKSNVNEFVKKCFFMKLISPVTLRAICDYMSTIYQLNMDDMPNFDQLRAPIREIVKALGFKANACLRLSNSKSKTTNNSANGTGVNASANTQTTNGNGKNNIEMPSPAKELEVEQDDIEDDDEEEEDEDDDEEDDDDDDDEDDEDETHPCPPGSSSCDDESSDDDDNRMEQQTPSISGQSSSINNTKCKRCGGDHSLEDQQSQSSSDKQSTNGLTTNTNTLTYQQKRQRSIAKRLQLRRKKKN